MNNEEKSAREALFILMQRTHKYSVMEELAKALENLDIEYMSKEIARALKILRSSKDATKRLVNYIRLQEAHAYMIEQIKKEMVPAGMVMLWEMCIDLLFGILACYKDTVNLQDTVVLEYPIKL